MQCFQRGRLSSTSGTLFPGAETLPLPRGSFPRPASNALAAPNAPLEGTEAGRHPRPTPCPQAAGTRGGPGQRRGRPRRRKQPPAPSLGPEVAASCPAHSRAGEEPRAPPKTRSGFWPATRVGWGRVEPPRPGETGSVPPDTLPAGVLASRCARSGMLDSALALPRGLETGIPVPTQRRATWAPGSPSTVGLETRAPGSQPPSVQRSSKSAAVAPVLTSFPFGSCSRGGRTSGGSGKGGRARESGGARGGAYKGVRKSRDGLGPGT